MVDKKSGRRQAAWGLALSAGFIVFLSAAQKIRADQKEDTASRATVGTGAFESKLGKVDFPTSGSEAAQTHFLRGVAALHSFWYEEALEAFRESTKIDADFMMGYWGEAMAHNHPLWGEQDTAAARKVIQKIKDVQKLTPREQAYLNAVR